jgi:hypothetical protein
MTRTISRSLLFAGVTLAAAAGPRLAARAHAALPDAAPDVLLCDTATAGTEHQYAVTGRVKLLLIWTGRREVGMARFVRTESNERVRSLSLLVGTDPDRAPMRVNRWGYIAEATCDAETLVTGVMTESKEQSVEQARLRANERSLQIPLRAIRSRVSATESATESVTITPTRTLTYRDLGEVLSSMPSTTTIRRAAVPPQTDSGFLRAVLSLIDQSAIAYTASRKPPAGLQRAYVYGDTIYDLTLRHSRPTPTEAGELESDFVVRNRTTGSTSQFQISYGTSGGNRVARRIVFRPRWWLELELLLKERP